MKDSISVYISKNVKPHFGISIEVAKANVTFSINIQIFPRFLLSSPELPKRPELQKSIYKNQSKLLRSGLSFML